MAGLWVALARMQSVVDPVPAVIILWTLAVAPGVYSLLIQWWGDGVAMSAASVALVGNVAVGRLVVPVVPNDRDSPRFQIV